MGYSLMKIKLKILPEIINSALLLIAISLIVVSCSKERNQNGNRIIIGIESDV